MVYLASARIEGTYFSRFLLSQFGPCFCSDHAARSRVFKNKPKTIEFDPNRMCSSLNNNAFQSSFKHIPGWRAEFQEKNKHFSIILANKPQECLFTELTFGPVRPMVTVTVTGHGVFISATSSGLTKQFLFFLNSDVHTIWLSGCKMRARSMRLLTICRRGCQAQKNKKMSKLP